MIEVLSMNYSQLIRSVTKSHLINRDLINFCTRLSSVRCSNCICITGNGPKRGNDSRGNASHTRAVASGCWPEENYYSVLCNVRAFRGVISDFTPRNWILETRIMNHVSGVKYVCICDWKQPDKRIKGYKLLQCYRAMSVSYFVYNLESNYIRSFGKAILTSVMYFTYRASSILEYCHL